MASQQYNHKTLTLKCVIESNTIKKNPVSIRNPSNLNKLLANIIKKFAFLSSMDDSEWCICINSQIIDKQNGDLFDIILSRIPPPVVIEIIRNQSVISGHNTAYIITVGYNGKRFVYKLMEDKDDWDENTYYKLQSAIKQQFNLYCNFGLFEDVNGEQVDIDDMDDIITIFDDGEKRAINIFVKVSDQYKSPDSAQQFDPYNNKAPSHNNNKNNINNNNQYKPPDLHQMEPPQNNNNNNDNNDINPYKYNAHYEQHNDYQQQQQQRGYNQHNNVHRQAPPYRQIEQKQNIQSANEFVPQPDPHWRPNNDWNIHKHDMHQQQPPLHNNWQQPQKQQKPRKESQNKINFKEWLIVNQLSDLQIIASEMTLDGLLNLNYQDIRASLSAMGLGLSSQQINRLNKALDKERRKSSQQIYPPYTHPKQAVSPKIIKSASHKAAKPSYIKQPLWDLPDIDPEPFHINEEMINDIKYDMDSDISVDEVEDDGEHPVWPLIIPNNCSYDARTGRMSVDHSKPRHKLIPYKPALEFIRKIKSKVATISIVGKARTGKSLIAGELYAPGKIPCPFDLGHKMDACTYGVWVSAKTVKSPYQKDTVVLIFDVEGTGFHQASKHNDMQLMVITLLISSYFIYNSKGAFDAPALDEIKFVLELTKNIHTAPNERKNDGLDFKNFFPIFMWLLRDVHLEPVINNKRVSVRDYFTQKVLSSESGFSEEMMKRQFIRKVFIQMFAKYDAFALPMPHGNKKVLQNLGSILRSRLQPAFNQQLDEFCDKVLRDTKCKTLFSKDNDGENQYIHCNGSHLAGWIEQCIESVNSNKIPEIKSMTDAVMANVYREAKKKAVKQYKKLLDKGLVKLRNNDDKQPLNEKDIIDLHIDTVNKVLNSHGNSLQPTQIVDDDNNDNDYNNNDYNDSDDEDDEKRDKFANERPQIKVFREFCKEIGHNTQDIKKISQRSILNSKLIENSALSMRYCKQYLDENFTQNIEPMLQEPKENTVKDLNDKLAELEDKYYKECKGPSKDICWKEFETKTNDSIQNFKRIKGVTEQLLKAEQATAKQREEQKRIKQVFEKRNQELELQQKSMKDELARIKSAREAQVAEQDKKLKEAEQRLKDMKESQFAELAESFKKTNKELNDKLIEVQAKNKKEMAEMMKKFNGAIEAAGKRQPSHGPYYGGGMYPYHGGYYGYTGMLPYSLIMSTKYGGPPNSYEHLISDDANMGAGTQSCSNSFIEAYLGGIKYVSHIEVKGCGASMSGGWAGSTHQSYGCVIQYKDANAQWITLRDFSSQRVPNQTITPISLGQSTDSVRVYSSGSYASIGMLRVFGSGSPYYPHHQAPLVLHDDSLGASAILQPFENAYLQSILPQHLKFRKYRLLYRASYHGWSGSHFHSRCDNQGETITIIHSANNHVFGGYTSLSWTSRGNYGTDKQAFIFLLRSQRGTGVPQRWNIKASVNGVNAIYDASGNPPRFGGGHDFYLCNNCNTSGSSYANFGSSYDGKADRNILAGSYSFKVKEYEVWRPL